MFKRILKKLILLAPLYLLQVAQADNRLAENQVSYSICNLSADMNSTHPCILNDHLNLGHIPLDSISIAIIDVSNGKPLYLATQSNQQTNIIDAQRPMTPASLMKLVTTYSALVNLKPDFRWVTTWQTRSPISNGRLMGNLYWKGSGDPVFDQKDIIDMQQQLQKQGIRQISGSLVLDNSIWNSQGTADGFEDDAGRPFTTPPDPHMVAYKVMWVEAQRQANGKINAVTNPPLGEKLDSHLSIRKTRARCSKIGRYLHSYWDGNILHLTGRLPFNCLGQKTYINIMQANEFASQSFIGQWRAMGGVGPTSVRNGQIPANTRIVAQHESPPLSEVITDMNKVSNNLIARTIFLTIGSQKGNGSQILNYARDLTHKALVNSHIDDRSLFIENGSGLSRNAHFSPMLLADILYHTYHAPFRDVFMNSLPIAGIDGTMKHRLRDVNNLHMKTGSLSNTRGLAGYLTPDSGALKNHTFAIVAIINHPSAGAYIPDLDNIIRQIAISLGSNVKVYTPPKVNSRKHITRAKNARNHHVHRSHVSVLSHGKKSTKKKRHH